MSRSDDPKKSPFPSESSSAGNGSGGSPAVSTPLLNRAVQAQLGQRLRHFYESLALGEQPVPDRFIELINRLDQSHLDQGQSEKPQ
jgi:hypothetical protein